MACAARSAIIADANEFSPSRSATGLQPPHMAPLAFPMGVPAFALRPIQPIPLRHPTVLGRIRVMLHARVGAVVPPLAPQT